MRSELDVLDVVTMDRSSWNNSRSSWRWFCRAIREVVWAFMLAYVDCRSPNLEWNVWSWVDSAAENDCRVAVFEGY